MTAPTLTPFGEQKLAVILACFPDTEPVNDVDEIHQLIFENGSRMLKEMSYEKAWLTGEVSGWIKLDNNFEFYGKGVDGEDRLVKEAVVKADPIFDFSPFELRLQIHISQKVASYY